MDYGFPFDIVFSAKKLQFVVDAGNMSNCEGWKTWLTIEEQFASKHREIGKWKAIHFSWKAIYCINFMALTEKNEKKIQT